MSYKGYFHRILVVDLSQREAKLWSPPAELWEKFLGGKGAGLKILYDLGLGFEPFSPENPLIFLTGPVTGSPIPTSARSCVVFLSPLTNSAVDSHAGGFFGPALRQLGLDGIIVFGKSPKPVYLEVRPDGVRWHEAEGLWGQGILATERALKARHPGAEVASIGPAGENRVRFACVGTGLWRQFGRGGAGAVMGAKNLKAIVVPPGTEKVPIADEPRFSALNRELIADLLSHPMRKKREELGTAMWIRVAQEAGFLPTRNFQAGRFAGFAGLTSEAMKEELSWEPRGCFNCPIRCGKLARWDGFELEGPEHETAAFLGANCGIGAARAVAYANLLCDDLGLDTISTGVVISFALEAAERGLLDIPVRFGDAEAVFTLIRLIAERKGVGDLLAEGTRIAAERLGPEAQYFAIQVGGMELSGVNSKGCASMALSLATADFASHTRFWSATAEMQGVLAVEAVPKFVKEGQDEVAARNSLIVCDFLPFGFDRLAPVFSALTGMEVGPADLLRAGERIENLHRLINLARGRDADSLPERFFSEPCCSGLFVGRRFTREDFQRWLSVYYALRGWDEAGRPKDETLAALGLPGRRIFLAMEPGRGVGVFHEPVLPTEVLSFLEPKEGKVFVDATVGTGGHAEALLSRRATVIGIDQDPQSLAIAQARLSQFGSRFHPVRANFRSLSETLTSLGLEKVDGVLFDLGLSSLLLSQPERGFSFQSEGPLDMRMDPNSPVTAADLVNELSEEALARILREYGEERYAERIAREIVRSRPIRTTLELAEIAARCYPAGPRRIHPATRTFQALRIAVNDELAALAEALPQALEALRPAGVLCVIAFHSLEDRIVKRFFQEMARQGRLRVLTKKPVRPSAAEVCRNPRSRSARLRAAQVPEVSSP